jgi:hypothetical protein
MDTKLYLGLPGSVNEVWCPFGGVGSSRVRPNSVFTAGDGSTRVQRGRSGNRTYRLDYGGLGAASFQYLESIHSGHLGAGPFVFLDPARRNLLTVNQSSSTQDTNSVDDFAFVGGSGQALSSTSAQTYGLQTRSVLWSSSASSPLTAQLRLNSPSVDWPGWPVIPRPYSFGCGVLGGGLDATMDLTLSIDWYSLSGATLVSTTSTATITTTTSWQFCKLENANPPAGAAWCIPYVNVTGATISTGSLIYFGGFQLNEGATVDTVWSPGTGILPVVPISLDDVWAYGEPGFHKSPTLVLQEVGG